MTDDFDDLFLEETPPPPPGPPWYLLTGLIIGLALGLAFAWALSPVRYTDTHPASLRTEFKDEYRLLIAQSYRANDNPGRAVQRLALLEDPDPAQRLAEQRQELNAAGRLDEAAAIESLAAAFVAAAERTPTDTAAAVSEIDPSAAAASPTTAVDNEEATATFDPSQAIRTLTPSPAPTQTRTPPPTPTIPQPTETAQTSPTARNTPTARAGLPADGFRLLSQQQVCDPDLPAGLLQIEVVDGGGQPLSGVRLTVRWDGGADTFRTGLYSEISAGYADFVMQPEVEYSLSAGDSGEVVNGLSVPLCDEAGRPEFFGGWRVQFGQ